MGAIKLHTMLHPDSVVIVYMNGQELTRVLVPAWVQPSDGSVDDKNRVIHETLYPYFQRIFTERFLDGT